MICVMEQSSRAHRTLGRRLSAAGWRKSSPRLEVSCCGASCRVELACGKDALCLGHWGLEVAIDGVTVAGHLAVV